MSKKISLHAPAKINWTLEVLGRRGDGYHEIRTVLQTIALADTVTVEAADDLQLTLSGEAGSLSGESPEDNLAFRAARLLQEHSGCTASAHIEVRKRIPVAAGLGGGSSDAAATLRGLTSLWCLSIPPDELTAIAAQLGSDVPFFLSGGTALGDGRGDQLTSLPDVQQQRLVIAWPNTTGGNKTAQMYSALHEEDFTDGTTTGRLIQSLEQRGGIDDEVVTNTFEAVLHRADPEGAQVFADAEAVGHAHLAGSGPAIFFLLSPAVPAEPILKRLHTMGLIALETHTISAAEALGQA